MMMMMDNAPEGSHHDPISLLKARCTPAVRQTPQSLLALGSTCRRLLQLSRDPALWTLMTVDWQAITRQEDSKEKHLDCALRRASKLHSLTIKNRTFEQIKSGVVASLVRRA